MKSKPYKYPVQGDTRKVRKFLWTMWVLPVKYNSVFLQNRWLCLSYIDQYFIENQHGGGHWKNKNWSE
jgi:hypothetical protein